MSSTAAPVDDVEQTQKVLTIKEKMALQDEKRSTTETPRTEPTEIFKKYSLAGKVAVVTGYANFPSPIPRPPYRSNG